MRGRIRFWSKTKHGEKKLSREKQASGSEAAETHGNSSLNNSNPQSNSSLLYLKVKIGFLAYLDK